MEYLLPTKYVPVDATSAFSKIAPSVIRQVFRDRGWGLPDDYAAFLEEWNGLVFPGDVAVHFPIAHIGVWGAMVPNWPPTRRSLQQHEANSACLGFLSGIDSKNTVDDVGDLLRNQERCSFCEFVPHDFIRIGDGRFDDALALAIAGPHFGTVAYFAGAETNWPLNGRPERTIANLEFVAPTFRAFWDSLVVVPIE